MFIIALGITLDGMLMPHMSSRLFFFLF
jgi:hypothetical protein